MDYRYTKDVDVLMGDPKKAIRIMVIPIFVALVIEALNNLIDAVWVTGLGSSALASVGVFFPFFFILLAISNGISIGASQAISRRIGADDAENADFAAVQGLIMIVLSSFVMMALMIVITPMLVVIIGGPSIKDECMSYAYPIIIGAPVMFLSMYFSNLLRSEGSAMRSMGIQVMVALINMVLDPVFIYIFGWGLMGAAVATVLSMFFSVFVCLYWYKIRKNTFLKIPLKRFKFDWPICKDIFSVGIPAAMEMVLVSLVSMFMNTIINGVGGTEAIAIYSSGWRILNMMMMPMMAMSMAVVPVCAAAYGSGRYDNLSMAYIYAVRTIVVVTSIIMVVAIVFAPQLCVLFTYSEGTAGLKDNMVGMLRIMSIFLPFAGFGIVSSGFFQSLGMGMKSLISTLVMNFLQVPICIYMLTFGTLLYIWWGITIAEVIGSMFMGLWGIYVMRSLMKKRNSPEGGHIV